MLLTFIAMLLWASVILWWNVLSLWIIIPAFCTGWFLLNKAVKIFYQFEHKMEVFRKLTGKLKNRYDLRYCQPYMDSACMRLVVYFSLSEIGKQKDYRKIKKQLHKQDHTWSPRIFNIATENGRLIYTSKDFISERVEDI